MALKYNKLDKFYFDLGLSIKRYREASGLSLEQLGFEMGIGKADVFAIEKGKNVTILTLLKISIILEVPLIDFLNFNHNLTISDVDKIVKSKEKIKKNFKGENKNHK